jgi:hypothetical protein
MESLADRLHRHGRLNDEDVLAAARIVLPLLDHAAADGTPHPELRVDRVLELCPTMPGYTLAHVTADAHPLSGAPLARRIIERSAPVIDFDAANSRDISKYAVWSHERTPEIGERDSDGLPAREWSLPLIAPEYVLTRSLTPAAEVWSAGALLWWLLAGRPPYSFEQWVGLALDAYPPTLPAWPSAAPHAASWWAEPLAQALAPDPSHRPLSPLRLLEMCAAAGGVPAFTPHAFSSTYQHPAEPPTPTTEETMNTTHHSGLGDAIAVATYDVDGLYRQLPTIDALRIVAQATGCAPTWEAVTDTLASCGFGVVPDPAAGDASGNTVHEDGATPWSDEVSGTCVIYAAGPAVARTREDRDRHVELYVYLMSAIAQAEGRTTADEFTLLDRLVRAHSTVRHAQLLRAGALARWLGSVDNCFERLLLQLDGMETPLAHDAAATIARIVWADGTLGAAEAQALRRLGLALGMPDDLATRPIGTLAA